MFGDYNRKVNFKCMQGKAVIANAAENLESPLCTVSLHIAPLLEAQGQCHLGSYHVMYK